MGNINNMMIKCIFIVLIVTYTSHCVPVQEAAEIDGVKKDNKHLMVNESTEPEKVNQLYQPYNLVNGTVVDPCEEDPESKMCQELMNCTGCVWILEWWFCGVCP